MPPFGIYADFSPVESRIVYSTCEYKMALGYGAFTQKPQAVYELAAINPDGSEKRRLTHSAGADHYPSWSPGGSKFAVRLGVSQYDSISGIVISTATRTGDDWRMLVTDGGTGIWGLRFCNFPAQGPEFPHDLIPEEYCE